jgi:hypothetical protein
MQEHTLDNGHTVRIGMTYVMNYDNQQLGVPQGTELTVTDIERYPDGIHILFDCEFQSNRPPLDDYTGDPTTIYAFAMDELMTSNDLYHN